MEQHILESLHRSRSPLENKSDEKQRNSQRTMPESLTDGQMATLWTRMGEIYGYTWIRSYGSLKDDRGRLSATVETWRKGLAGLTPQQIAHGLNRCLREGNDFPPSLPTFYGYCRSQAIRNPMYVERRPSHALEQRTDPEVADVHIEHLRNVIK